MAEKRYQVFVSSTYRDLKEYRQTVIKSLLEMNALPVGMELFPATDDDAWTLIKRVIDQSDYYLVIIGGRYGSVDEAGVSFTEKEYDYAVTRSKPVIAFLHADPEQLSREYTEVDAALWNKLQAFREKAKKKVCRFWKSREELVVAVLTSYVSLTSTHPAVGWVRGDQIKTDEDLRRLSELNDRIARLEADRDQLSKENKALAESNRQPIFLTPRIVQAFAAFSRRLKVEWELEHNSPDQDENAAEDLLRGAAKELLEYVVEIDESRHFHLSMQIRQIITDITSLLRAPKTSKSPNVFQVGFPLVHRIDHLKAMIDKENWAKA